jgi:hypothetical protein
VSEVSTVEIDLKDPLVRRALTVVKWLRDPALTGLIVMALLAIGGAAGLYFGWRGIARTIYVPLQLPGLISGGLGGVALIGLGLALFDLQMTRRDLAAERRQNDELLHEVASLVVLAPKLRGRQTP